MTVKPDRLVFAMILALGAVVLAMALWGTQSHPTAHPEVAGMTRGGAGSAGHDDLTLFLGWLFGVATIGLFVALMAFGARRPARQDHLQGFAPYLWGGIAAHLAVWTALMLSYRSYLKDPEGPLFLFFPAPTAVMLYLMLPVPVVFVLYFIFGFRRWVLTAEEQAAYEQLLEAKALREGEES